ncbi:MAG TPA: hypothetical protein PK514_13320 [Spirochaetota bacterium]|nr:hypothetical protein [Spirochaetota bacterium]
MKDFLLCDRCGHNISLTGTQSFSNTLVNCSACDSLLWLVHCGKCGRDYTSSSPDSPCLECGKEHKKPRRVPLWKKPWTRQCPWCGSGIQFPFMQNSSVITCSSCKGLSAFRGSLTLNILFSIIITALLLSYINCGGMINAARTRWNITGDYLEFLFVVLNISVVSSVVTHLTRLEKKDSSDENR